MMGWEALLELAAIIGITMHLIFIAQTKASLAALACFKQQHWWGQPNSLLI